jgi:hypothetical protein
LRRLRLPLPSAPLASAFIGSGCRQRSGPPSITFPLGLLGHEGAAIKDKPLLYVDVDGVISLWGFDPDRRPPGAFATVDGIVHFLSSEAGEHLQALAGAFELVWCTGWEEKAGEYLPHALGVPALDGLHHLSFARETSAATTTPGHWKLAAVDAHAGARPAAWIDDALNDACEAWASARGAPTLLVHTEPATGLVATHAERLRAWAREPER